MASNGDRVKLALTLCGILLSPWFWEATAKQKKCLKLVQEATGYKLKTADDADFNPKEDFFEAGDVVTLTIEDGRLLTGYLVEIEATEVPLALPSIRGFDATEKLTFDQAVQDPQTKGAEEIKLIDIVPVTLDQAIQRFLDPDSLSLLNYYVQRDSQLIFTQLTELHRDFKKLKHEIFAIRADTTKPRWDTCRAEDDNIKFPGDFSKKRSAEQENCSEAVLGRNLSQVLKRADCKQEEIRQLIPASDSKKEKFQDKRTFLRIIDDIEDLLRHTDVLNRKIKDGNFQTRLSRLRRNKQLMRNKVLIFDNNLDVYRQTIELTREVRRLSYHAKRNKLDRATSDRKKYAKEVLSSEKAETLLSNYETWRTRRASHSQYVPSRLRRVLDTTNAIGSRLDSLLYSAEKLETCATRALKSLSTDISHINRNLAVTFHKLDSLYKSSKAPRPTELILGDWSKNTVVRFTVYEKDFFEPFRFKGEEWSEVEGGPESQMAARKVPSQNDSMTGESFADGTRKGYRLIYDGFFAVHKKYQFNVVAALAFSKLNSSKDQNFQTHEVLGVNVYLFKKRDLFPGALSPCERFIPHPFLGLSPTDPDNFFLGLNFELITGFDITGGLHINVDQPPLESEAAPIRKSGREDWFVSVGFDLNILRGIFGSAIARGAVLKP